MVCLAVSILLGVSAKAQQIDTLIYMVSGEQLISFNTDNEVIGKKTYKADSNMKFTIELHEVLFLDFYDKRVRKNMFDKKMIREIVYTLRNEQQDSEVLYTYSDGFIISGRDVKSITIKPMIR